MMQNNKKNSGNYRGEGRRGSFQGGRTNRRGSSAGDRRRDSRDSSRHYSSRNRRGDRTEEPARRSYGYEPENEKQQGFFRGFGHRNQEPNEERSEQPAVVEPASSSESRIEGRNAVIEAFRSGRTIDRLYMLDGSQEGPMQTIRREAEKHRTPIRYVSRQRLDQLSETGSHQGVVAVVAAYHYAQIDDLFDRAQKKGEDPFFIFLDNIEDPHNLGAIIRTANVVGAHGVIIPKDRAVGLTATVAKASAGAINYTPVCRVTNMARTIEELKKKGMWFVCADMDGVPMTKCNMEGSIGLVIGAEGSGVSRLVKEKCDMIASIPQRGEIDSLNASVACGVLAYEILRQRQRA